MQNSQVIIIDDLSGGSIYNIPAAGKIHLYSLDVRDELIEKIYLKHRPCLLFHLAACYANELSIDDPVADLSVNAGGTIV